MRHSPERGISFRFNMRRFEFAGLLERWENTHAQADSSPRPVPERGIYSVSTARDFLTAGTCLSWHSFFLRSLVLYCGQSSGPCWFEADPSISASPSGFRPQNSKFVSRPSKFDQISSPRTPGTPRRLDNPSVL